MESYCGSEMVEESEMLKSKNSRIRIKDAKKAKLQLFF